MRINWEPQKVELTCHPVEKTEYKIFLESLAKIFYKEISSRQLKEKFLSEPIEFESVSNERTGTDG